jgi:phthiocerol/phenolphthiocerol synthesis type-I polyketide synthase B
MACRFPGGGDSPQAYWKLLLEGRDAIGEVPSARWDVDAWNDSDRSVAIGSGRWGGFLDDIARFDAAYFGIPAREAAAMDPQQRILLEVAYEAMQDAALAPATLKGSRTGVFAGTVGTDYQQAVVQDAGLEAHTVTGNLRSITVGRLAYLLDLRGPSVPVDTACSSSLVAVHLAVQSLRLRESDLAFAGGVNVIISPQVQFALAQGDAFARDGRCKSFDASADGLVRGEGCGVVLLKRLTDALADGDRVHAVIRGTAVNSDGRSQGITAPNGLAQRAVLSEAVRQAGIPAQSIGLVETHGTGTPLGDPIEFEALAAVYGDGKPGTCAVGAVKSNIGHLEGAAGVAGLIKAILAVRHGLVPPNLHFRAWNPAIDASGTRLFVPTETGEWPVAGGPRRAAVSSFGLGGTNAHAVVEQAAPEPERPAVDRPGVFPLSARSAERLRDMAAVLAGWLREEGAQTRLDDVAETLARRSAGRSGPARAAIVARTREELAERLDGLARGAAVPGVMTGTTGPDQPVWVFSGHGGQWAGMGRGLLAAEPAFAETLAELEPVITRESGFSVLEALSLADEAILETADAQPLLFAMQLGIGAVLKSYGVRPAAVVGHSMGEVAAAVVAGALTPADGARVICRRARLLAEAAGDGAMAVTQAAAADVEEFLERAGLSGEMGVAVTSGPATTVVSGAVKAVERFTAEFDGGDTRLLQNLVASHSPLMEPLLDDVRSALAELAPEPPNVPFYSTVTSNPRAVPLLGPAYWAGNLRRPVRLMEAVRACAEDGHSVFVEIGPHPVLARAVADTLKNAGVKEPLVLPTLRRRQDEQASLLSALAALVSRGRDVPSARLFPGARPADLPTAPWKGRGHWLKTDGEPARPPIPGPRGGGADELPADWHYRLAWHPAPLPQDLPSAIDGRWLIFADRQGVGQALADLLTAQGARCRVVPADAAPALEQDLEGVTQVVHLGALDGGPERATAARDLAGQVTRLAQHLAGMGAKPPRLRLVTRLAQSVSGESRIDAAQATLWGLGRCLVLEKPEIWGGIVDLDPGDSAELATLLLREIAHAGRDDQAAYRGGRRHVPRLERAPLPEPSPRPLDPDGAHLVVGATGRIGHHLLRRLADLGARHFVLVSRRGLPEPVPVVVAELRERGATLTGVAADVADERAMTALMARFGADLPPLRGIYHAAYEESVADLADVTDEILTGIFRPKVIGVDLLDRLSAGHDVREFLCYSSTAALTGSRTLLHYAAASAFVDAVAHDRKARGLPAHVVNWGGWLDGLEGDPRHTEAAAWGLRLMPGQVASRALTHVVGGADVQYVVTDVDWDAMTAAYRTRTALAIADLVAPPPAGHGQAHGDLAAALAAGTPVERHELLTRQIRAVIAKVMDISPPEALDVHQDVIELGIDSISSVMIQRRLLAALDVDLPSPVIFEHPTVDALAGYLDALLTEQGKSS